MSASPEIDAMRQRVEAFPKAVTARLRAVAFRKSREVMAIAKRLVRVDTGYTRDHIHVVEEPENKQFIVKDGSDQPQVRIALHRRRNGRIHTQKVTLNMLPIWIERGTRFMQARPFMRPAADAVEPSYRAEMAKAAEAVAEEELTS